MKKLTVETLAKAIWQREIDQHEHNESFEELRSIYEEQATFLLTLFHETIGQDAAYALGEEAFRAGYEKCLRDMVEDPKDWVRAIDAAWTDYEPSEAVKALIE